MTTEFALVPFDQFILEEELFHTHAEHVGKDWDDVLKLNWPLAGSMAGRGELFVLGAKVSGRLVGYAVIMLGADLLDERLVASLVFLFARPEYPLLGMRLAREAGKVAKVLGCAALWLFETRDSSHSLKLHILAKRFGGKHISTVFEVSL